MQIIETKKHMNGQEISKMFKKLRNLTAGLLLYGLVYASGCSSPLLYKDFAIDSQEYRKLSEREKSGKGSEKVLMLGALLNELPSKKLDSFEIKSMITQNEKEIKYSRWLPKKSGKEVIVYINGLESHGGWFAESARKLAERGIDVYAIDRRGSGINARVIGNYEDWVSDVHQLIKKIKEDSNEKDINLVSLCFGARVATAEVIKNKEDVKTLAYISPGFDMKVDLNCCEKNLVALSVLSGINSPVSSPIKRAEMFTRDEEYLGRIKSDLLRVTSPNASDFYQGLLLLDFCRNNSKSVKIPMTVMFAGRDEIIDINKTKGFFYGFGSRPEIIVYKNSDHTIFFSEQKEEFIKDLTEFIERN